MNKTEPVWKWTVDLLAGVVFVLGFIVMGIAFAGTEGATVDSYSANAIYRSNYDGDTIKVDIPGTHPLFGENISIRISGIDTPELRARCLREKAMARRARQRVRELLTKHKDIVLEGMERGKYFRIVAKVNVQGVDVGQLLIDEGLAVPYFGGRRTVDWCNGK